jgi:hypothetical protein
MEFVDDATLSSGGELTERSSGGISRRSVMKAGAHVAWAVPLVQVVAAAPAVAASPQPLPAQLALSAVSGSWNGKSANFKTSIQITNSGGSPAKSLQVQYTFPTGWTPTASAVTGWTLSAQSNVYTFTSGSDLGVDTSVTFNPQFSWATNQGQPFTITVSATSTGSNTPADTINVPAAGK